MKSFYAAVAAAAVLVSPAAFAQDKPADNMAIVMEKVAARTRDWSGHGPTESGTGILGCYRCG